jgi:hypothetical protein
LLARARPAVVIRVRAPPAAEQLFSLPLEIARRAAGQDTVSRAGVCFVFERTGEEASDPEPVGERLRILALHSLPPSGSPLNLCGASGKCCVAAFGSWSVPALAAKSY